MAASGPWLGLESSKGASGLNHQRLPHIAGDMVLHGLSFPLRVVFYPLGLLHLSGALQGMVSTGYLSFLCGNWPPSGKQNVESWAG